MTNTSTSGSMHDEVFFPTKEVGEQARLQK